MNDQKKNPILSEILYMLELIPFAVGAALFLFALCFLLMGISVRMIPEMMNSFTVFGWPVILFVFMVVAGVKHVKTSDPADNI